MGIKYGFKFILLSSSLLLILIFKINSNYEFQKVKEISRVYTKWFPFDLNRVNGICLTKTQDRRFSNLENILLSWKMNFNLRCRELYYNFNRIYEIRFKKIEIKFPEIFFRRIEKKLGLKNPFKSSINIQVFNF